MPAPNNEDARIGVYFQFDELAMEVMRAEYKGSSGSGGGLSSNIGGGSSTSGLSTGSMGAVNLGQARLKVVVSGRLEKWFKMASYGLEPELAKKVIIEKCKAPTEPIKFSKYAKIGLMNFYEAFPNLFKSRLSKGPPPQYRWLAWKVAISKKLKRTKGLYEELMTKSKKSESTHDILKDLDRTFPHHPFFNKDQLGNQGQKALMNALLVFSVYDEHVGYCQSMNFVMGFIMMINGGNEKEAFWLFAAMTK